jgi:ribonucleoside-diphosphate reductase alpha chain
MSFIQETGHAESRRLAQTRGAFPLFGESTLRDGEPVRNATVTTICANGTLSIIASCSSAWSRSLRSCISETS